MIYFVQDSSTLHVKIGHTAGGDAEARRRALQTGNPSALVVLATMPGEQSDERELHRRFASDRVAGEWFRPVPALLLLIGEAREMASGPPLDVPGVVPAKRLRFYLAGKMDRRAWNDGVGCWREAIVTPKGEDCEVVLHGEWPRGLDGRGLPILDGAVFGWHDYVGPYYFDDACGHTGWDASQCGYNRLGEEPDPWDNPGEPEVEAARVESDERDREAIRRLNLDAIRRADVVFAWLDSLDCYGTLAEIGYAHAAGRKVWAASPRPLPDLWFAFGMAEWSWQEAPSALGAFARALTQDRARHAAREAAASRHSYSES